MPIIDGKYYSERELAEVRRALRDKKSSEEFDSFVTSAVVGAVTGSSIIGAVAGGSLLGGLFGDVLEGTDDSWF